mmetsp:Transcript_88646/g.153235  ORF Transcript_88646/g.153235 Transcript_88646/m.153235 type:complete len:211 (-) Transcript_88646:62-694(-)
MRTQQTRKHTIPSIVRCLCKQYKLEHSEFHLMRIHVSREREFCLQVCLHVRSQRFHHVRIHLLLAILLLLRDALLLSFGCEERRLTLLLLLLRGSRKVCIRDRRVITLQVHLGAGGDAEALVHASERNAIHGVWTCDEEQATFQLLQKNDTAPAEAASEQDKDCPRGDASPQFRRLRGRLDFSCTGLLLAHGLDGGATLPTASHASKFRQ